MSVSSDSQISPCIRRKRVAVLLGVGRRCPAPSRMFHSWGESKLVRLCSLLRPVTCQVSFSVPFWMNFR